jgi:hypothetical protein
MSAVALIAAQAVAGAQYPRNPRTQMPTSNYYVGLSYGLYELGTLEDGKTGNEWNFGYTTQLAATLEKTLSGGGAIGVIAGFASPRLTYRPIGTFDPTCCTAKADVTQLLATARLGGGFYGFRSSIVIDAGATQFANFRDAATDLKLTGGGAWDPTFGTGYELGVALTPKTDVYFSFSFLFVLHDQGNAVSTTPPFNHTMKIGVRQGF